MTTPEQLKKIADFIVADEVRRDKKGHLAIYKLPSGDGGGTHEVAGINNRYHPDEFQVLSELIYDGEWEEAESYVRKYLIQYTNVVTGWQPDMNPGIEYFLRDSAFNRGPTGAARILQLALNMNHVDGRIGPATRGVLATQMPEELLAKLRKGRETYERRFARRDERSKFWNGLVSRWNKVTTRSAFLIGG